MDYSKILFIFVFFFLSVFTKKITEPAKCPTGTKLSIVASDLAFDNNTMVLGLHPETKKVAVVSMELLGDNKFWCIGIQANKIKPMQFSWFPTPTGNNFTATRFKV